MLLSGLSAIVTGAGWGIGRACSVRFAEEGADLTLIDLNSDPLDATAEACTKIGARVQSLQGDVSRIDVIERTVELATTSYGRIDVLVNCAVHRVVKPFLEVAPEDLFRSLEVNVAAYYLMIQRVVPHMKVQGGGSVVNVASQLGFVGAMRLSVYCVAKGAQVNMTRALALELAEEGIRVNGVAPGPTDTEGLRAVVRGDISVLESRLADVPMHRLARPEEIAEACLFLASDRSSFVTGHNLVADGGFLIH
jgi:NAD(P)-dependent dehydrogenase (short-subunit alcohol dehydrogenase family)